mmetsp:Transcript_38237/g.121497  ORF Transcript_38237/g.121497 Transcript_38237/m.121497 type:complete len:200 (-) Transcript_38237:394-993(-)
MAAKEPTMSCASTRAASQASFAAPEPAPLPPSSPTSQRRRASFALSRISTPRSSRPLRLMLATEFRRAMHATRRRCSWRYSGTSKSARKFATDFKLSSRSCSFRSCSTACTMSLRAFASMLMSSVMYWCSKSAQAWSRAVSAPAISCLVGLGSRLLASAWFQRSSCMPRPAHACWRCWAWVVASALNSNLSPFTHIAES